MMAACRSSRRNRVNNVLPMKDFMELKDNDLQKYILSRRGLERTKTEIKSVDDDDKKGWWLVNYIVRQNNQGKMYIYSTVKEYIVYDKKKKKGRVSAVHRGLLLTFIKHHFNYAEVLLDEFILKLTPTLVKKIVEGKIATVEDIMKYHRSYTLKNKNLSLEVVYRFNRWRAFNYLSKIEDPENITSQEELNQISYINEGHIPFKFKTGEIPVLREKYDRWAKEQDKKYVALLRQRNEECGNIPGQEFDTTGTTLSRELLAEF